jgi:hypothetical protein
LEILIHKKYQIFGFRKFPEVCCKQKFGSFRKNRQNKEKNSHEQIKTEKIDRELGFPMSFEPTKERYYFT